MLESSSRVQTSSFYMLLLFLFVFSGGLISGVTKYLQNECHLAAKFETRLAAFLYRSSLLYVSHIVEWCYYSCSFWKTLFSSYRDD